MKLKLHREAVMETERPEQGGTLRFPVRAVRAMPAPGWRHERSYNGRTRLTPRNSPDDGTMNYRDVIRGIEATLDRMQAKVTDLHEQVQNFKFPGVAGSETDRPRAA